MVPGAEGTKVAGARGAALVPGDRVIDFAVDRAAAATGESTGLVSGLNESSNSLWDPVGLATKVQ